jgi:hypothetical protein
LLVWAVCVASTATAAGIQTGRYVRVGSNNTSSATLTVHASTAGTAVVSLHIIAKPSASATTARTGTLERETLALVAQQGMYREADAGAEGCSIAFSFKGRSVHLQQDGQCSLFGVGIDATGNYSLGRGQRNHDLR